MSDKLLLVLVFICGAIVTCCHLEGRNPSPKQGDPAPIVSSEPPRPDGRDSHIALTVLEETPVAEPLIALVQGTIESPTDVEATVEEIPAPTDRSSDPNGERNMTRRKSELAEAAPNSGEPQSARGPQRDESIVQIDGVADDCEPRNVDLSVGELQTLRVDTGADQMSGVQITDVQISDRDVCEAILTDDNKIQLIGTGLGQATLVVNAVDAEVPRRITCEYSIFVIGSKGADKRVKVETVEALNRAVKKVYPDCQVAIRVEGHGLVVEGNCDEQDAAEEIVDLVRKVCLVNVRDELRAIKPVSYYYPDDSCCQ